MYSTTVVRRLKQRRLCDVRTALTTTSHHQAVVRTLASWNGDNVRSSRSAAGVTNDGSFRDRFFFKSNNNTLQQHQSKFARFKSTLKPSSFSTSTVVANKDKQDEDDAVVQPPSYILDFGLPKLIPEWRKMFSTETLFTDISAGLTVGCIAVPLSLAIAVASGVPPEVGLVTAAVSCEAGGLMGGTTLAVTGPAAAISLIEWWELWNNMDSKPCHSSPWLVEECSQLPVSQDLLWLPSSFQCL